MLNIEQNIWNSLPKILQNNARVSISYQDVLKAVQSNLQTIYGERADWKACIANYYAQSSLGCRAANTIEDIPIIAESDILKMIVEEEQYEKQVSELLNFRTMLEAKGNVECDRREVIRGAEILGILPERSKSSLFSWNINRQGMLQDESKILNRKLLESDALIRSMISLVTDFYMPGHQIGFPFVGTVVMQPKGKHFFRGENAYYRKSVASLYRNSVEKIPFWLSQTLSLLRINETCMFFDNFDAVKNWNVGSDVNYIALAQHYGARTPMIDLTRDLRTALFFACCTIDSEGKWKPLTKDEIENADSRKNVKSVGGDSRYGILYQMLTEINDMEFAVMSGEDIENVAIPIGYQPFMRCSAQYGFMWFMAEKHVDLLLDRRFEKYRFRLTEEFCRWIYEQMDEGRKVYPVVDIPDISSYISKIDRTRIFSRSSFESMLEKWDFDSSQKQAVEQTLKEYGYYISNGEVEHISNNRLRKINRQYNAEKAAAYLGVEASSRPMIIISPDCPVKKKNGQYVIED